MGLTLLLPLRSPGGASPQFRIRFTMYDDTFVVIDGDKIKYFNDDKQIVDSAYIRLADDKRTAIPGC